MTHRMETTLELVKKLTFLHWYSMQYRYKNNYLFFDPIQKAANIFVLDARKNIHL